VPYIDFSSSWAPHLRHPTVAKYSAVSMLSGLIVVGGDSLASAIFSETHMAGVVPVVVAVAGRIGVFPMCSAASPAQEFETRYARSRPGTTG
jgi:hypothetical protein